MAAIIREYPSPADFYAPGNAERGLQFSNLRGAIYKAFLINNDAQALFNEFNRGVSGTLITGPGKVITALTSVGTLVTVTAGAHGLATGRVITMSGCTPAAYNGDAAITVVNSNTFTYVAGSAPGAATVIGAYSPHPAWTASGVSLTANGGASGINTGIVMTGDVVAYLLTQKTGSMGIFSSSLAASNGNILGFQGTSTQVQFHNSNSSGAAANINWPADIGTKMLFCCGWGRVHGFPFMVVGLNGVLSGVVTGATAGGDRVPTPGDGVWYFARPNGGNGVGIVTMGALFDRTAWGLEEAAILAEAQAVYDTLRLVTFPGLVY